jgi:histone-lysine N-methyltransferase SETMAR
MKLQWAVLPHPPYSPELAPLDFHLFKALKDAIYGTKSEDDDKVNCEVKKCLCEA